MAGNIHPIVKLHPNGTRMYSRFYVFLFFESLSVEVFEMNPYEKMCGDPLTGAASLTTHS